MSSTFPIPAPPDFCSDELPCVDDEHLPIPRERNELRILAVAFPKPMVDLADVAFIVTFCFKNDLRRGGILLSLFDVYYTQYRRRNLEHRSNGNVSSSCEEYKRSVYFALF